MWWTFLEWNPRIQSVTTLAGYTHLSFFLSIKFIFLSCFALLSVRRENISFHVGLLLCQSLFWNENCSTKAANEIEELQKVFSLSSQKKRKSNDCTRKGFTLVDNHKIIGGESNDEWNYEWRKYLLHVFLFYKKNTVTEKQLMESSGLFAFVREDCTIITFCSLIEKILKTHQYYTRSL